MNEEIERMNKKVIISLNEYLELENIKKCHKENMKISYGKVLLTSDDYERYKAIEHNWNELKKWLEEEINKMNPEKLSIGEFNLQNNDMNMGRYLTLQKLKELTQELEEGGNNDNNTTCRI